MGRPELVTWFHGFSLGLESFPKEKFLVPMGWQSGHGCSSLGRRAEVEARWDRLRSTGFHGLMPGLFPAMATQLCRGTGHHPLTCHSSTHRLQVCSSAELEAACPFLPPLQSCRAIARPLLLLIFHSNLNILSGLGIEHRPVLTLHRCTVELCLQPHKVMKGPDVPALPC